MTNFKKLMEGPTDEQHFRKGSLPREQQVKNAVKLYKMSKMFSEKLNSLKSLENFINAIGGELDRLKFTSGEKNITSKSFDEDIVYDIEDVVVTMMNCLDDLSYLSGDLKNLEKYIEVAMLDTPAVNYDQSTSPEIQK